MLISVDRKPEWQVPDAPPPAHRISAASLHAARVLLECYTLHVKPNCPVGNLKAEERELAVFLDILTNIHRPWALKERVRYWIKLEFLEHARDQELLRLLDEMAEAINVMRPGWAFELKMRGRVTRIPEVSRLAAQGLLQCLDVQVAPACRVPRLTAGERHVAITCETSMNARYMIALRGQPEDYAKHLRARSITRIEFAMWMRRVGTAFEYLPSYGEI